MLKTSLLRQKHNKMGATADIIRGLHELLQKAFIAKQESLTAVKIAELANEKCKNDIDALQTALKSLGGSMCACEGSDVNTPAHFGPCIRRVNEEETKEVKNDQAVVDDDDQNVVLNKFKLTRHFFQLYGYLGINPPVWKEVRQNLDKEVKNTRLSKNSMNMLRNCPFFQSLDKTYGEVYWGTNSLNMSEINVIKDNVIDILESMTEEPEEPEEPEETDNLKIQELKCDILKMMDRMYRYLGLSYPIKNTEPRKLFLMLFTAHELSEPVTKLSHPALELLYESELFKNFDKIYFTVSDCTSFSELDKIEIEVNYFVATFNLLE
jgi:hypothetical protein